MAVCHKSALLIPYYNLLNGGLIIVLTTDKKAVNQFITTVDNNSKTSLSSKLFRLFVNDAIKFDESPMNLDKNYRVTVICIDTCKRRA